MTCPCKSTNPKNLREVVKCVEPTLFHRVDRPASLGDEAAAAPETLDYKNVLLVYQANGHAYLYSSDGVPTFISYLPTAVDALEEAIKELQQDLANEALERHEADTQLKTELEGVEADQFDLVQSVNNLESTSVQKDTTVSADASTVTVTKSVGLLNGEATETAMPLPVASEDVAGVMNTATFKAVQDNAENIDSILGGAVVIDDLPVTPTQDELTAQWKATTGKTRLINRASIYDTQNKLVWYYYENANEWKSMPAGNTTVSVSIATNDTPGIVKGSDDVFIEPDGSMSVVGLDGIHHDIDNLSELVAGIDVPKVPYGVSGIDRTSAHRPLNVMVDAQKLHVYTDIMNSSNGQWENNANTNPYYGIDLPFATESTVGIMTTSDKTKLNSLLEIKSLNDSLELDEDGQLSVVGGGGSGINLLSTYTATVATSDVYNAEYINARLNGTDLRFGKSAVVSSNSQCMALGQNAYVYGLQSIALGYGSRVEGRNYTLSIGTPVLPRYITNIRPGTQPTDAVNLQQMQDYVSENSGNPFTEMETTRVKNLPPAVVTGFEDTTYGTEAITMHLDTKDLATGGVSVQELTLEGATANTADEGGRAGLMTAFQATQLSALATVGVVVPATSEEITAAWEAA